MVIPSRLEAFGVDAGFGALVGLETVERQSAESGEIFRSVANPDAVLILAKAHIQLPMQIVFDGPVAANPFQHGRCIVTLEAADVIASLGTDLAVDLTLRFDNRDATQSRPGLGEFDPLHLIGNPPAHLAADGLL